MWWSYELDLAGLLSAIGASRAGDLADLQGPRREDDPDGQELSWAAELDLVDQAVGKPRDLTGVIADQLPAGPGLAAWLSNANPDELTDWDLPGVAAAFRRVASWAQAGELSAVAAMASRAAARDAKVGVGEDGRPCHVTAEATSEVSLALTMSHAGASWWTNLAVALRWRLAATGHALAAGTIDVSRARLIAEATGPLQDEAALEVQARILPQAGDWTTGQLRAALRRAVIAVDPQGADSRRENAERRAKVTLHPDEAGTAAIVASNLPGVLAAAAMARLSALARARKASGAGGGMDFLRAQALVGLVLGTLPYIPPPPGAPPDPDRDPDPDDGPGPPGPASDSPDPDDGPGPHHPAPEGPLDPADGPGPSGPASDSPASGSGSPPPRSRPPRDTPGSGPPSTARPEAAPPRPARPDPPPPAAADHPEHPAARDTGATNTGTDGGADPDPGTHAGAGTGVDANTATGTCTGTGSDAGVDTDTDTDIDVDVGTGSDAGVDTDVGTDADAGIDTGADTGTGVEADISVGAGPDAGAGSAGRDAGPWPDVPPPGDADAPPDDGSYPGNMPQPDRTDWDDDACDHPGAPPLAGWPHLPATTQKPPAPGWPPRYPNPAGPAGPPGSPDSPRPSSGHPPGHDDPPGPGPSPGAPARRTPGLLDLTLSWAAINGTPGAAATLSRLGPITTTEALPLAGFAALDPWAQWRVIVTDDAGQAIAVERIRRRTDHQPGRPSGIVGRVTVTIPATALNADTSAASADATGIAEGSDSGSAFDDDLPGTPGHGIRNAILRTACRAATRATQQQAVDTAAEGGCAHTTATPAYRPTTRIREHVEARDQTCRHRTCRQPAAHTDIDHTQAWHKGGITCPCNLGGQCRTHHKIKQLPGWTLTQPQPGHFELTTPAGRTYTTKPDTNPT